MTAPMLGYWVLESRETIRAGEEVASPRAACASLSSLEWSTKCFWPIEDK